VRLTPGNDILNITLVSDFIGPSFIGACGGAGTDTVNLLAPSTALWQLNRYAGFEVFNGSAGNDDIRIGAEAVTINAGAGDDRVFSGSQDATITLGAGSDELAILRNGGVGTVLDFSGGPGSNGSFRIDSIKLAVSPSRPQSFATHLPASSLDDVVVYNNSGVFPVNALVILTNAVLATTAAVDAFLDSMVLAPTGGVFVAASGGVGAGTRLYYDPSAANTGGTDAPELLAVLTNIAVPMLLISSFDVH
jgi:hypothetical protein